MILRFFFLLLLICSFSNCKDGKKKPDISQQKLELKKIGEFKGLDTPESIIWNPVQKVFYVSNNANNNREIKNEGFISKLNSDGDFIEKHWVDSLKQPGGMEFFQNKLFVTTKTELVAISLKEGKIVQSYSTPKQNTNLNDILKVNKSLLLSDGACGCLFQFKDNTLKKVYDKNLEEPDGLAMRNDSVFVVDKQSKSLSYIDLSKSRDSVYIENLGFSDGIAPFRKIGFFISDWEGRIFYINSRWKKKRLLDFRKKRINTTDIWFDNKNQKLYVPTLYDDRILIFKPEY